MADVVVGTDLDTYTPVTADVGANLYCRVTATNAAGSASANSNTVGPVTAASAGWTPADLPGLLAWYKADTGITLTPAEIVALPSPTAVTGSVNQWDDQSSNGYDVVIPAAVIEPTYNTTGFNGHPAVMFLGASYLVTGADVVTRSSGGTFSIFIVGQMLSGTAAGSGRLLSYSVAGATDFSDSGSFTVVRGSGTSNIACYQNSVLLAGPEISLATDYRLGVIFDGTNCTFYVNNTGATPVAHAPTFGSPGTIGLCGLTGGAPGEVTIAEAVITTAALDTTQRLDLDNYFKAKWGLTP